MKKYPLILLFPTIFFTGCSHLYYVPNIQNVPLLKEKDEIHFSAAGGGGEESSCVEVQGAYSFTEKFALMANYMSAKGGNVDENNYGKGNYIEGAIGFYKPLGRLAVFEIYGGLGLGDQHHKYGSNNAYSDLSSLKYFVQPSFGLTTRFIDLAVSGRISGLNCNNIRYYNLSNYGIIDKLNDISGKNHLFLEPAVTLRMGWKKIKIQFQVEYSDNLNEPVLNFNEQFHISLGLNLLFAPRYR